MKNLKIFTSCAAILIAAFLGAVPVGAQSLLSGDISGTVTDPSTAVVSEATVDLKSLDTGATQSTKTGANGGYRFSQLKPGNYTVTVSHPGFETAAKQATVAVSQVATVDLQLAVGQASQTIDVVASEDLLNSAPSGTTQFTPLEVQLLPSAGGDITNIAQTAAGVNMNTAAPGNQGYGNFSINGLSATSNLYTVNGENDMDPYFNINNSGATNLTLGQNEIQEATVIASPYGGEYGQLSGAQVVMVTKSGSNAFHGNAQYWWNGSRMNSNDWFNNYYGEPKPFSNANQWAASLGGHIRKNKTFFFFDDEGLRFILPNNTSDTVPTPAFANAVLANVTALQPAEAAAYKTMLGLWDSAPGVSSAVAIPNGTGYCSMLALPGFDPATTPCAEKFTSASSALATESVIAFRIDHKIGDRDNAYYRYRADRGTQPTTLDAVNANFDALSKQPSWDNQFSETHVFSPNATNQFMSSFSHYVAQFAQDPAKVQSTFPYEVAATLGFPFTTFNLQGSFPQGRNITQYQFIDDYTLVRGKHTLKFGENFRRYDVTDHGFTHVNPEIYFSGSGGGMQNFVNGVAYRWRQSADQASEVPIALWGMGAYAHDDWRIASNFTLTLGFRLEHNSNPVCQINCFANFKGPFSSLASVTSTNPGSIPYSSDISFGQHQAYQGVDAINPLPSAGFSYTPSKDGKTVISGGFGIFYDNAPAGLVDDLLGNPPSSVALNIIPTGAVPPLLPFDSGPGGGAAVFRASASAFNINQTYNQISAALAGLGASFAAPSITSIVGTVHSPRVEEWNFQVQQQLSASTSLTVNYVGNHSGNIPYASQFPNAYDSGGIYPGVPGIPATAPSANYGQVTEIRSGAIANYNGLQFTLRRQFTRDFSGHFNYTWSHAMDDVSNGGVFILTGNSLQYQMAPGSLGVANYGNAEYDIRHAVTMDFVWTPKARTGNKFADQIIGGWQLGAKVIYHTGLPFSVTDSNQSLGNFTDSLLAVPTGQPAVVSGGCGEAAVNTPCLTSTGFVDGSASGFTYSGFSPQTRNQYRGPGYFDLDLNLFRNFPITERVNFGLGISAYNALNHPNFANPDSGFGDATYGQISSMSGAPTSPYGNFLGFDSSVRVVQLSGKIVF